MFEILDYKKVMDCKKVVFGASNFGEMWFEILRKNKIEINYFADNSLEKWGGIFVEKLYYH